MIADVKRWTDHADIKGSKHLAYALQVFFGFSADLSESRMHALEEAFVVSPSNHASLERMPLAVYIEHVRILVFLISCLLLDFP